MSDQPRPKAHGRWSLYESDPGPLVYDGCGHPVDPLRTVQVGETRTCDRCGQDSGIVGAHLATQRQIAAEGIDPGADMRHIGQEIRRRPRPGPIVPASTPIEEATARIIDAAGKGKLALLVTDAAGSMIVGLQATGGLTELRPDGEGRWLFAGALTKPEVLEGSVVLRNRLGLDADQAPDDFGPGDVVTPEQAQAEVTRQLDRLRPRPALPAIPKPEDDSEADAFEAIKRYIRDRYGTAKRAIEQWRPGLNWYRRSPDE